MGSSDPPLFVDSYPHSGAAKGIPETSILERSAIFVHQPGQKPLSKIERRAYLDRDTDRLMVDWLIAGEYEISIYTGRVVGARSIRLSRKDLAWFRRHSRRWQKRRARWEKIAVETGWQE